MEEKKAKKERKPVKRTKKNVIKNLVKENQRIHDYNSPFGVRFWNKILRDTKPFGHRHKVFDKNIPIVIERANERWSKQLETETDPIKVYELKQMLYQINFFLTDEWKDFFDEDARLKPEHREILWLERCAGDGMKEYYDELKVKRRLAAEAKLKEKKENELC